jgi:hypothetical protein
MPDKMAENMPEDMPDRMPGRMAEGMPDKVPECLPDRMPKNLPDRMPDRMSEDIPENIVNSAHVSLVTAMCHFYSFWLRLRGFEPTCVYACSPFKGLSSTVKK